MTNSMGARALTVAACTKADAEALARVGSALRRYVNCRGRASAPLGLAPQQDHLLLAIMAFPGRDWATPAELADQLQCTYTTVVGLIDAVAAAGLVRRSPQPQNQRLAEVHLTGRGEQLLAYLVASQHAELQRLADLLRTPLVRPRRVSEPEDYSEG